MEKAEMYNTKKLETNEHRGLGPGGGGFKIPSFLSLGGKNL
jgi:hypothetical protein